MIATCCSSNRGGGDGRYTHATLVLHGGTEVSGAALTAALDALEAKLDDYGPPIEKFSSPGKVVYI